MTSPVKETIEIELPLLTEAIYRKYGYDFREYSRAHVKRRLLNRMRLERIESFSVMQHRVLHDPAFAEVVLKDLSINVTEMFRDPGFYRAMRDQVMPVLRTWSFIKIWHAGCSTGEEVYSMAIVLMEEGLYDRAQIYATDFNAHALHTAKEGIYPASAMKKYAENYQRSGAQSSFSDYYLAKYDSAILDASLKKNIVWANHNLVTDGDFTETHLVLCRNVLIYFNQNLQEKVHRTFYSSLVNGGVLCLGAKESLRLTDFRASYQELDKQHRIFKKKYTPA